MQVHNSEEIVINYRDMILLVSIVLDNIVRFNISLFIDNKKMPLTDYLEDSRFVGIVAQYNSRIYNSFKKITKYKFNLVHNLKFIDTEILLIDSFSDKVLIKSIIKKSDYTTLIYSYDKSMHLLHMHNINMNFINDIVYYKVNILISYIKLASRIIRAVIVLIIFVITNNIDPLQFLNFKEIIYMFIFAIYPFLKPISNFILFRIIKYSLLRIKCL